MCTVVVRWAAGRPVRVLALRDELTTREFDDPGRWWPGLPEVVGGRDRAAGGTWCATDVGTGVTALVLNRPQRPAAAPGAASRGVLPLRGVAHGADWPAHVRLEGMASFLLVLAAPDGLTTWDFDGAALTRTAHAEGTTMITSGGPEDRKADRHLAAFTAAAVPEGWRALVQGAPPQDDPGALVVRHERDGLVFATVCGQLIEARPGALRLEFSRRPWTPGSWQALDLAAAPGRASS
ncbi:NRDE family protein [Geodermatophilus marinus]|uniref:NRDE family protein n=1 Tax=Geodermatophilus sp. LHW52908 TaxID=2303986 RepID=UPI001F4292AE|nr:NRDE family protein [Geodermatophilus sp. LHW52908]